MIGKFPASPGLIGRFALVFGAYSLIATPAGLAAGPDWWNAAYQYRAPITVSNGAASLLESGHPTRVALAHAALVTGGKSQADGDDVRFVYWNGVTNAELARILDAGESWNDAATTLLFRTQASIAAGSDSGDAYWIYYGDPVAAGPPATETAVCPGGLRSGTCYEFYDDFDDGNYNGWTSTAGSWTAAGGFLRAESQGAAIRSDVSRTAGEWAFQFRATTRGSGNDNKTARFVYVDDNNHYVLNYYFYTASANNVHLQTANSGSSSTQSTWGVLSWDDYDDWHEARVRFNNGTWYAKFWKIGNAEPSTWLTAADTAPLPKTGAWSMVSVWGSSSEWDSVRSNRYIDPAPASTIGGEETCEPVISDQPDPQTVCLGEPASFSIGASGGVGTLTYQWRLNGDPIAGATGATYDIAAVTVGDAGDYDVVIGSDCGSTVSDPAELTVIGEGGEDCNTNGVSDECDIDSAASPDCDGNGVPDECDFAAASDADCNGDSILDACQYGDGPFLWIGGDGGLFTDSSNWDGGNTPAAISDAVIENPAGTVSRCRLDSGGQTELCKLVLAAAGAGRQILEVLPGTTLVVGYSVDVQAGGELDLRGGSLSAVSIANAANTIRGYGEMEGSIENAGLITSAPGRTLALLGPSLDNAANATVLAPVLGALVIESEIVNQAGVIEARAGGGLAFSVDLINQPGGQITLYGGDLGTTGLINAAGASLTGFGTVDGDTDNDGVMTAIADFQVVGNLDNAGTVFIQSGILTITGSLAGSGTIIGGFGGRDGGCVGCVESGLFVRGDFDLSVQDWRQIDLTNAVVQMDGGPADGFQTFEAPAADRFSRSITLPDASLYSIGTLRIGPSPTTVRLVDRHRNSPAARRAGPESVFVKHLVLDPGTTLDLAGLRMYYETVSPADPLSADSGVAVIDSVGGGGLVRLRQKQQQ